MLARETQTLLTSLPCPNLTSVLAPDSPTPAAHQAYNKHNSCLVALSLASALATTAHTYAHLSHIVGQMPEGCKLRHKIVNERLLANSQARHAFKPVRWQVVQSYDQSALTVTRAADSASSCAACVARATAASLSATTSGSATGLQYIGISNQVGVYSFLTSVLRNQ
jgi:hypothetical protein